MASAETSTKTTEKKKIFAPEVRACGNCGGVAQSDVAAVRWYRKAADQGQVQAAAHLGFILQPSDGRRLAIEASRY